MPVDRVGSSPSPSGPYGLYGLDGPLWVLFYGPLRALRALRALTGWSSKGWRGRKARRGGNAIIHETTARKFHQWKALQRSVAKPLSSSDLHQVTYILTFYQAFFLALSDDHSGIFLADIYLNILSGLFHSIWHSF